MFLARSVVAVTSTTNMHHKTNKYKRHVRRVRGGKLQLFGVSKQEGWGKVAFDVRLFVFFDFTTEHGFDGQIHVVQVFGYNIETKVSRDSTRPCIQNIT